MAMKACRPGETRLGWVGTGVMGTSMCRHLMEAGYKMTVYSRTAAKCKPLVDLGAKLATTPAEVARESDVVFTIVGFPSDVRQVILGPDGVLSGLGEGGCVVDMTTSEPSLAVEIAEAAAAKKCFALDAPVSGGDVGAREARLSIMVGGEQSAFDAVKPLFECMGKNIRLMGGAGRGQHTKMTNQILIATGIIGVCEGLLYAHKVGLNLEEVIAAVRSGAAGSWSLENYGPRMLKRDMKPGFFIDHFVKDLKIALEEADRMKLSLPGLALAKELYVSMQAIGHGDAGNHALILALERMNNMDLGPITKK
uniref:6-phosphogluconate dehydrogenase NADP-binding domain-containing protein n=1 Tax=Chromera velia CCMP2878 TaxID=1169474 RepID=A0A0G4H989_9ALVE|eukprot:Cvel_25375.t1-p1 / transcript=Cvel_25375.t1 / gene=Cvel_25375 / organism=Chromera_velia_CCMP2878 / gene_product=Probable 3-hydroxyisobutyrate dehydrogenase-like 1,, putative / transcript_product=Probable 3-hydroxyisobutyrate dehydrogenase-like 1,, putative / location=Cvel_scaffold2866:10170-14193(-) / protein_length=308 / sequence_SO=supercontig / SO=protein_coding / is_pseudo=false